MCVPGVYPCAVYNDTVYPVKYGMSCLVKRKSAAGVTYVAHPTTTAQGQAHLRRTCPVKYSTFRERGMHSNWGTCTQSLPSQVTVDRTVAPLSSSAHSPSPPSPSAVTVSWVPPAPEYKPIGTRIHTHWYQNTSPFISHVSSTQHRQSCRERDNPLCW